MRRTIAVMALLVGTSVFAHATQESGGQAPLRGPSSERVRVAQGACWFAIFLCSRSRGEAQRWRSDNGVGRVIHTSSDEYPNFQAGYYCVVQGPMGRSAAQNAARRARSSGMSGSAYAKASDRSC